MITISAWATPTRLSGIVAYGIAATSCAIAWRRARERRQPQQLARALTWFEVALVVDIVFNIRWMIHDALGGETAHLQVYEVRRGPQAAVLLVGLVVFAAAFIYVRRYFRGLPGQALAASGALLSLACWVVEVISLHSVDRIFYHSMGPVMAVAGIWWISALMTSVGILQSVGGHRSMPVRR